MDDASQDRQSGSQSYDRYWFLGPVSRTQLPVHTEPLIICACSPGLAILSWVFSPNVSNPSVNGQNHTLYDHTKSPGSLIIRSCGPPSIPLGPCKNLAFDIGYGFPNSGVQGFVVNDVRTSHVKTHILEVHSYNSCSG